MEGMFCKGQSPDYEALLSGICSANTTANKGGVSLLPSLTLPGLV